MYSYRDYFQTFFTKFHEISNGFHRSIQFTIDMNKWELRYLDNLIINDNEIITDDLYNKNTDTDQYLDLDFTACPIHKGTHLLIWHDEYVL